MLPSRGLIGAGKELASMITLYSTATTATIGLGTITLDAPFAQHYVPRLEHLAALGERTAAGANYMLAQAVCQIPEDRVAQVLRKLEPVIAVLDSDEAIPLLPRETHMLMLGVALYSKGALETFRDSPEALEIADRLETMDMKVFSLFANQIRANYHALRGDLERSQHFREQVELCAIQAGSGWQAEVWSGSGRLLGYRVTGDVIGLKRVAGELSRLAQEIPSLRTHANLALAGYYMLRGDHAKARALGYPAWSGVEPRGYIGWATTVAGEVYDAGRLGELETGIEAGRWALSFYDADDRQVCTMMAPLIAELAVAEARSGDCAGAGKRVEDYLAELGERGGPATRGLLHRARAQIAILDEDLLTARVELAHLERCYRPTGNPSLIAQVENLRREIEGAVEERRDDDLLNDTLDLGQADVVHVRTLLEHCEGRRERLDKVLALLVHETRGVSGYLFLREQGELVLSAPNHGDEPSPELLRRLEREVHQYTQEQDDVTVATATTGISSMIATEAAPRETYSTFLLSIDVSDGVQVVGAVAIEVGPTTLKAPMQGFLTGVAEVLVASGDVVV
jgi:hypothetical protein